MSWPHVRRGAALVAFALLTTGGAAAPAEAYVPPGATVISASLERQELADDSSTQVAISASGRFVAFTTRARNFFDDSDADPEGQFRAGGIFRRDLESGRLELVAHGELRSEASPDDVLVRGAVSPSLSADGRFVAFSTGYQLTADDTNGNVDVYVRDMDRPIGDPAAFELVSRSSTGAPARYAQLPAGVDRPGVNPGADLTARHAISGDGRFVVFRTADIASDLPSGGAVETPGNQLLVRDRVAGTTQLVTQDRSSGAPAGGAVGGSAISLDGSTVVWAGREAPRQTVMLPSEGSDPVPDYYLLRRIADGAGAQTLRVTGFADPQAPGCDGGVVVESPTAEGPCYGPLGAPESRVAGLTSTPPVLSADGTRVAYLTATGPRGLLTTTAATDVWITDVRAGSSRRSDSRELTRDAGTVPATNAPIDAIDLSADGRWVAFTTQRTEQLLPTLRLSGAPRAAADARDLYLADLAAGSYELATRGLAAPTDGPVSGLPALDATGRRAAFVSAATNLFFGDANARPDAFVLARGDAPPAEAEVIDDAIGVAPAADPAAAEEPPAATRLTVRARAGRRGKVTLRVTAPEPLTGTLQARGTLRDAGGRKIGKARVLARRSVKLKRRGTQSITLTFSKALRSRLRAAGKIPASARIEATGASGREYVGRVTVEFRR